MVWRSRRFGAVVGTVVLAIIAGCTPATAPSATPTSSMPSPSSSTPTSASTPTVTPTWDAEQTAAIEAVRNLADADEKIGANPAAYTEKQMTRLLEPFSGGDVLTSTIRWHLRLKEHGYHFTGEVAVLSVQATKPVDEGRGTEVHVTQCQDQRQGKVVDKDENPVSGKDFQLPAYNLRQYAVRKPPGEDAFRVFGFETINGACP